MPYDIDRIEVRPHSFAVGLVTLQCPCSWRETVPRPLALPKREAHAVICPACQVGEPDGPVLQALSEILWKSPVRSPVMTDRQRAAEILRLLRSQGYDIIRKETP